ncbi:MAG TPA: multiheme c-type cytochrome [Nitrospiraceae bacterium]|jgi:hydroxylamine dehydrogenase
MVDKFWLRCGLLVCGVLLAGTAQANFPTVPKETYDALKLDRSATPKELHEALVKRYLDPAQGYGKGKYGEYWKPIPMSKYFDPGSFYTPPKAVKEIATREQCVKCHTDESPGWVQDWKRSTHANLDKIRKLTEKDDTYYKKAKLEAIEANLRSIGKLGAKEQLKEVGCIDCHYDINTKKKADHQKDLRMATADTCGTCHLQEFAERESERDTITWPKDQWPKGRPSHALDYKANVEVEVYAGMSQREIADGCTGCHINQNKCDTCHARHEFSASEARKSEACGTCHNGADHNNWEAYNLSKHGLRYQREKGKFNWNVEMKEAIKKGGQSVPTCQSCHMEYQGKITHNVVRKVRWANYPFVPGIRENISTPWSEKRLDAWVKTCTQCHSETYARAWLDFMDQGTYSGLDKYDEAHDIVHKQYEAGLLTGQKTNRPEPPKPVPEGFEQFFQIYWSKGNNPAAIELKLFEMAEDHLVQLHVSLAHQYWGYTYTVGWAAMNRAYVEINDEDTKLKEKLALQERVAKLEAKNAMLDLDGTGGKITLGSVGGGMMLAGTLALAGWSRRKKNGR